MTDTINRLYIEPTSNCNLACPMCTRNHWINESIGDMDMNVFNNAMAEVRDTPTIDTIFFGGIGEPLVHPHITSMIEAVKALGRRAELITNGTMLSETMITQLIQAGLDQVWISIDSIEESEYTEIRDGADYQSLIESLQNLQRLRVRCKSDMQVGISFVLQKANVSSLPKLPNFARKYNISDIKVSNLIPTSEEMVDQTLYDRSLSVERGVHNNVAVNMDIPYFDLYEETERHFLALMKTNANFSTMGTKIERKAGYCKFVEEGNVFIRWDGEVSPCMELLHTSKKYLENWQRTVSYASFGNFKERSLREIWNSKEYSEFRERVKKFDFSPCILCGGCDDLDENNADCYGNPFPTCGGCLWAQGFVQCP